MSENLIDELTKRLNAKTIHELRQLGRALGVPHPADGRKQLLIEGIIAVASGKKDPEPPAKRGAPPKSQVYDRQLASDILRCREIFLAENLDEEESRPSEIFVASDDNNSFDYIGGGILEFDGEEWFLRTTGCREDFIYDVFVNKRFVINFNLREGDYIEGRCKRSSVDEMAGLASVLKVNGLQPDAAQRVEFDKLSPIYANKKLKLACGGKDKTGRIIDLFAPIGAGQRVLVVSPHGCGKTQILKRIASCIEQNNKLAKVVIVLIDVSPEDATDFTQSFNGADVFTSPIDAGTEAHIRTMRLALEYCKRQAELCTDVVLIIDNLTSLVRAYNAYGKQSFGLDYAAVDSVKKILGSARNTEKCGSLTIISALNTASGDTIEDTAYSALKDIGNVKITLSQSLARSMVYPPIDFSETFSTQYDRLLTEEEMQAVVKLKGKETQEIFALLDGTEDNKQLVDKILR